MAGASGSGGIQSTFNESTFQEIDHLLEQCGLNPHAALSYSAEIVNLFSQVENYYQRQSTHTSPALLERIREESRLDGKIHRLRQLFDAVVEIGMRSFPL